MIDIGNGAPHTWCPHVAPSTIRIPDEFVFTGSETDFILWAYPNIAQPGAIVDASKTAILAPLNSDVDLLNETALSMLIGDVNNLPAADSVVSDTPADAALYPIEYLNSVNVPGLPPSVLKLKVGAPVILLRTLNADKGLVNGTRLIVKAINRFSICATIVNGTRAGTDAYIPRIDMATADGTLPFTLKRRQFPVKLAFAMTINKSQGQSLERVGVFLPNPIFAHGQVYVALSRAGVPANTKVLVLNGPRQGFHTDFNAVFTPNVVYPEVL